MNTTHNTQQFTGGLTQRQQEIVSELCSVHGLDPAQISFDAFDDTPIFDYEAVSTLSLKLTDIKDIDATIVDRRIEDVGGVPTSVSKAKCIVTLPDGRTRSVEETAYVGEEAGGYRIATTRDADGMAQNRAVRRGVRSVGINLWRAHQAYMRSGQRAAGTTDADPRQPLYAEVHVLAGKLDLIVDGDRTLYESFIAESFGGVTSAKDLNDLQLVQLRNSLRAMASVVSRSQPAAA